MNSLSDLSISDMIKNFHINTLHELKEDKNKIKDYFPKLSTKHCDDIYNYLNNNNYIYLILDDNKIITVLNDKPTNDELRIKKVNIKEKSDIGYFIFYVQGGIIVLTESPLSFKVGDITYLKENKLFYGFKMFDNKPKCVSINNSYDFFYSVN